MDDYFESPKKEKEREMEKLLDKEDPSVNENGPTSINIFGEIPEEPAKTETLGKIIETPDYKTFPSSQSFKLKKKSLLTKSMVKQCFCNNVGMLIYFLMSVLLVLSCIFFAKWELNWKGWYSFVLVLVMFGLLLKDFTEPEFVLITGLAALVVPKVVDADRVLAGFSNDAIFTIGVLFVVSKGIENTNVLSVLFKHVLGNSSNVYVGLIRMMVFHFL